MLTFAFFKLFIDLLFIYRYTRNLVDEGNGKYNLMLLCWGEGHGSAIHDHANAHCFMKMLQGELEEVRFSWPEKEINYDEISDTHDEIQSAMQEVSRSRLELDGVCYINGKLKKSSRIKLV